MQPLPLTDVATGAWSISATAASDGPGVDAAQPGVDAHPAPAIAQVRQHAAVGSAHRRRRAGGRHRAGRKSQTSE